MLGGTSPAGLYTEIQMRHVLAAMVQTAAHRR